MLDDPAAWKLLQGPAGTLKHIPKVFRSAYATELRRLLDAAEASGATMDCVRLLLFEKAVLAPLRRGGTRGKAQARLPLGRRTMVGLEKNSGGWPNLRRTSKIVRSKR